MFAPNGNSSEHLPAPPSPPPGTLAVVVTKPAGPLGIVLRDYGPDAQRGGIKRILVEAPGPIAQQAGIFPGDQIVGINGNMVTAAMPLRHLLSLIASKPPNQPFNFYVVPGANRPIAPVMAQPQSVPMATVVYSQPVPTTTTTTPTPARVPNQRFDPNTGEELPKFDPNTGVQNWWTDEELAAGQGPPQVAVATAVATAVPSVYPSALPAYSMA